MKKPGAGLLSLLFVAWVATVAGAQQRGGPGFGGFGSFGADKQMLLNMKQVQEELKLDDKQTRQLEQRFKKQRESFADLREMEPEDAAKTIAKQSKANDTALAKLLTSEQYKRLSQVSLQQRGLRALGDVETAKALALTTPQKAKIKQIQDKSREEMQAAFEKLGGPSLIGQPFGRQGPTEQGPAGTRPDGERPRRERPTGQVPPAEGQAEADPAGRLQPGPDPQRRGPREPNGPGGPDAQGEPGTPEQQAARKEAFEKIGSLRKGTDEKLLNVLNTKQQAKWQEMQGEPFKLQFGPPQFGPRDRRDANAPPESDGPRQPD